MGPLNPPADPQSPAGASTPRTASGRDPGLCPGPSCSPGAALTRLGGGCRQHVEHDSAQVFIKVPLSLHTREHPSATKRRKALTLATTWMDPENTMLSEGSRHRRTHRV